MKVTVINGSPRGKKSATQIMVNEFLKGMEDVGAETSCIFLSEKKINPCMGCFTCWFKTPGKCIHKDDHQQISEECEKSNIMVFAAPIYVGSVPGIMKNYIDRLICDADPHMEIGENGISRHVITSGHIRDIVLISNCGFPEMIHFDYFRSIFKYLELIGAVRIIGEIYKSQGHLLNSEGSQLKPLLDQYKALLQQAGREIAQNKALTDDTQKHLNTPFVPAQIFIENANKYIDQCLGNEVET